MCVEWKQRNGGWIYFGIYWSFFMLILFSAYQVSNGRDRGHLPEFLMINPRMDFLWKWFRLMRVCGERMVIHSQEPGVSTYCCSWSERNAAVCERTWFRRQIRQLPMKWKWPQQAPVNHIFLKKKKSRSCFQAKRVCSPPGVMLSVRCACRCVPADASFQWLNAFTHITNTFVAQLRTPCGLPAILLLYFVCVFVCGFPESCVVFKSAHCRTDGCSPEVRFYDLVILKVLWLPQARFSPFRRDKPGSADTSSVLQTQARLCRHKPGSFIGLTLTDVCSFITSDST